MRFPDDLEKTELVQILASMQRLMYLDVDDLGREVWDPDKPCCGADLCDRVAELLAQYRLAPNQRQIVE